MTRRALLAAMILRKFSSFDTQAKPLLARMTLDERIGQMTQAEQSAIKDPSDIDRYFLGSVLSGGNSDPKEGNSLQAWTDQYDRFQQRALKTRLQIPLLYGIDAVHGHNNVLGAVIFPHNIGLGCTRNAALVERVARVTAEEVRATGINWTFAPCVAVPQDVRWGRTYEGYSEDPSVVRDLGAAAVLGLQGESVLACAKHYIGDGGTAFGSAKSGLDQGDTRITEEELRRVHLPGYISAIRAGVGTIMPSYSSWNGTKVSGDKRLLTDLLKTELGFDGFLISDYNAIDQIKPGDFRTSIQIAINAGMDMAMVPTRYKEFLAHLKSLTVTQKVPISRINDAVLRILRVKFAMGLTIADRKLHSTFGSAEHREVAREAVRQSAVLLKNDRHALPLSKSLKRIHLAGRAADDIGIQCGGWTISWQGRIGAVTTGTTILAAMRKIAQVTYSKDGTGAKGADVAVIVAGELPYAEGAGDRANLSLAPEDLTMINNVKAAGVPTVLVLISGRPISLSVNVDAVLAVWLPGTEGQGVADVLFGDYNPTGKLSFHWSKPALPLGYGLSY